MPTKTTTGPARGSIEHILADELRATGLTNAALARRLGMSTTALADRLRGRTRWTTTEIAPACQLAGITVTDLYNEVTA